MHKKRGTVTCEHSGSHLCKKRKGGPPADSTTCNIFGSTDGTCILYDAFGREVERGVNGVYTEVMYTPVGKTAIMNGQTTTINAYFPLPGGATYYQTGTANGSGYFWHKDWLGSVRLSSSVPSRTFYFDRAFAPYGEMYKNFGNTAGLNFTGDTQDSFTGLYDTPNRELHPSQGRWLSPDPSGLNANQLYDPQYWNRYEYVRSVPVDRRDPGGLCDVAIAGITEHSMAPSDAGLTSFANSIGANLVFPYAGGNIPSGLLDVVGQAVGLDPDTTQTAIQAINQAAEDPGPINVFTFSGGAQAFNSALSHLSESVRARINNVTYVSPGAVGDLAAGNGKTTVISNPTGLIDSVIYGGSMGDANWVWTDCGHEGNCTFPQQHTLLSSNAGNPCSRASTYSVAQYSPVWDPPVMSFSYGLIGNDLSRLMLHGEIVTHKINLNP